MKYGYPEWIKDYQFIGAPTQNDLLARLQDENVRLRADIKAQKSGRWEIVNFAWGVEGYEALLRRDVWRVPD